jgi:hypothetical protein
MFGDTAGKWYESDINAIALQGIYIAARGDAWGEQVLTREEAVEMLYRAFMGADKISVRDAPPAFIDQAEVSPEYSDAVKAFRGLKFISGYADGSFHPKEQFTRAQVVTILNNIIGTYITKPGEYDIPAGANVCIASPNVSLKGKGINYIILLPGAAEGFKNFYSSYGAVYGIAWDEQDYSMELRQKLRPLFQHYKQVITNVDKSFAGGAGIAGNPYMIANEAQLRMLNQFLSEEKYMYYFELANDITLSPNWEPIGAKPETDKTDIYSDDIFFGKLDGGGHIIKNLNINYKGDDRLYFGLFSQLAGTVRNLTIQGSITVESVTKITEKDRYGIAAGAIAGVVISSGMADNCHSSVDISVKGPSHNAAGGLVGMAKTATMQNCTSSGKISVSCSVFDEELFYAQAGGILGGVYVNGTAKILDCVSTAQVAAAGGYQSMAGGIAGAMHKYTIVERCFASGTVHAEGAKWQNNAGGLIGHTQGSPPAYLRECGAATDVSAAGNPEFFNAAGGLVGAVYDYGIISNCYSKGTIKVDGTAMVGGLVGRAAAVWILTSYTVTKITATESLSDYKFNGLIGPVQNNPIINACGVFNVSMPHFLSFEVKKNVDVLNPVGNRSLSDIATYKELGSNPPPSENSGWDFDKIWTFASSGSYPYPILRKIAENIQRIE